MPTIQIDNEVGISGVCPGHKKLKKGCCVCCKGCKKCPPQPNCSIHVVHKRTNKIGRPQLNNEPPLQTPSIVTQHRRSSSDTRTPLSNSQHIVIQLIISSSDTRTPLSNSQHTDLV